MHLHVTHGVGLVNVLELNHRSRFGHLDSADDGRVNIRDFLNCLHDCFRFYPAGASLTVGLLPRFLATLPASTAARSAASSWRTAESWRRRLVRIRFRGATRQCLTRNTHLAFDQIAFDDFSRRPVRETNLDPPALRLTVLAHHPDSAR